MKHVLWCFLIFIIFLRLRLCICLCAKPIAKFFRSTLFWYLGRFNDWVFDVFD